MIAGRIPFGEWALRVFTWDAFLPAAVAYIPMGLEVIFPGRRGLVELAAVILPVTALFVRYLAGRRLIGANCCPPAARRVQRIVFVVGLFPLALMECVLILSALIPAGAVLGHPRDRLVWAILAGVYLLAMTVAMYPGRVAREGAGTEWETDNRSPDWT